MLRPPRVCATLQARTDLLESRLTLRPSACRHHTDRERCLLVPVHPSHYPHLLRLVSALRQHAEQPLDATIIAVLSSDEREDLEVRLRLLCAFNLQMCDGALDLEWTDLQRLIEVEDAWHGQWGGTHNRSAHAAGLMWRLESTDERKISDTDANNRTANVGLPRGFFQQALKKLLGTALTRCSRVWVVDAESVPFHRFSSAAIFDDYWNRSEARVLTNGGEHISLRQHYLLKQSLRMLSMPLEHVSAGYPERHPVYRYSDSWHWSADGVRALMARAITVGERVKMRGGSERRPPSFVEAFLASPTHELVYYTYAQAERPSRHRFVPSRLVEQRVFGSDGAPWSPEKGRKCSKQAADLFTWAFHLRSEQGLRHACQLLAHIGEHAYRFQPHTRFNPCYTGSSWDWLTKLALRCGHDGILVDGNLSGPAAFEWWLCEDEVLTLVDPTQPIRPRSALREYRLNYSHAQSLSVWWEDAEA